MPLRQPSLVHGINSALRVCRQSLLDRLARICSRANLAPRKYFSFVLMEDFGEVSQLEHLLRPEEAGNDFADVGHLRSS